MFQRIKEAERKIGEQKWKWRLSKLYKAQKWEKSLKRTQSIFVANRTGGLESDSQDDPQVTRQRGLNRQIHESI